MDIQVYVPLTPAGIREWREYKGISREELSKITSISLRTIESYEQNPKSNKAARFPSKENAALLGEALQCYFYVPWEPGEISRRTAR